MDSFDDRFETVAITWSRPEAAVMLSMFTFYGIPAFALGYGHASVAGTFVVALQGIHIRVHHAWLDEATGLLAEVAERPRAVRPPLIEQPTVNAVVVTLACLLGLAPVPPSRTSAVFRRPTV